MAKIRGVNLGNWLVLEQWMDPSLFDSVVAENLDETSFSLSLGDKKRERLKYHRDHFITRADFDWIKNAGLNSVRIPVPHWIFDDVEPYVGCIEYLDKAFDWAESCGLSVLIDLHTAPGCQNGFDNGGITGVLDWYKHQENIDRTVMVIGKLAARYRKSAMLYGIELLNEPSWDNPREIVRDYYVRGYHECRKYLDTDRAIVFHDQFDISGWQDFMLEPEYANVVLDTHCYQCFDEVSNQAHPIDNAITTLTRRLASIREAMKRFPVIVGEWSLGLTENEMVRKMSSIEKNLVMRTYADVQLLVQEQCLGWYFWSYKLNNPGVDGWNYRTCVEKSWIPVFKEHDRE